MNNLIICESKKLPICEKPSINTYADLAYINAILETKMVLKIYIENWCADDWNVDSMGSIEILKTGVVINALSEDKDIEGTIWRTCSLKDELIFYIDYYRRMDDLAYVELFCTNLDNDEERCSIAMTNYGFYKEDKTVEYNKQYRWFKLTRENDVVKRYASVEGAEWDIIASNDSVYNSNSDKIVLGIKFFLGNRQLCAWNSMNYLQICLDLKDIYGARWLDYYMFPRKGYDHLYGTYSYFFDVEYFKYNEICEIWGSLDTFAKYSISRGYYLLVRLDEFYLPERPAYNEKHHEHDNLLYGYDMKNYYVMGYNQKVINSKFPVEQLDNACYKKRKVVRYRLATNEYKYKFDLDGFLGILKEFIEGKDSSKRFCNILTQKKVIFGLDVFVSFLTDEKAKTLLLSDRRIPYFLWEHCSIMLHRLEFLITSKYVKNVENIEELRKECRKMTRQAEGVLFLFLKHEITRKEEEKVLNAVKILFDFEKKFYTDLYEILIAENKSRKGL